jgi:hypothetical protein
MSGFSNRQDLLRRSWEAGNNPALRSQAFDGATSEEAAILQGQERANANPQIGIASRQAAADWRIAKSRGVRGVDFKEWRARRAAEMTQANGSSNAAQNSSGQPSPTQTPPVQASNPNDPSAYGSNPLGSMAMSAWRGLFGGQGQSQSPQAAGPAVPQVPQGATYPESGTLSPPRVPKMSMAPVTEATGQSQTPPGTVSPNTMGNAGQNPRQASQQQPFRMPPWGALVAGGAPGAIYSGLQGYGAVDGYFNGYSQEPQGPQDPDNGVEMPYGRPPIGSYLNKLWRSARGR